MGLFGPSKFSRKYGEELKRLNGQELATEFQNVLSIISEECQTSDMDRAGYLILENLSRIGEQVEQRRFVADFLRLNSHPSRGVVQHLSTWLAVASPETVKWLVDALITCAIEKTERYIEMYPSSEHRADEDFLIGLCIDLSIQHQIKPALQLIRSNAKLHYGNTMILSRMMSCAMVLEDTAWQENFLQRLLDVHSFSDHNECTVQAIELVKRDQFSPYRDQLFNAIYRCHIVPERGRGNFYQACFLKVLAQMAVYFKNVDWQDRVYRHTMKQVPNGSYGHTAYEALIILAPVHEASRKTIASTPRPEFKFILRAN